MSIRRLAWVSSLLLGACSAAALALLARRVEHQGAYPLGFLRWNLTLAWLPFLAALAAHLAARTRRPLAIAGVLLLGGVWFVFLPNAPYILTDALHLRQPGVVLPFDALLIAAFGLVALALGVVSLRLMHDTVQRLAGSAAGWVITFAAVAGSALGVWLGRVWRWNSWDLLDAPVARTRAVAHALLNAERYALSMTLAAGVAVIFFAAYAALFALTRPAGASTLGRGPHDA